MRLFASLLLTALCLNPLPTHAESEFIPEASAACLLGNNLIIGGDEEPQSLWISQQSGKLSKIKVANANWDDLEGLASFDSQHFFAVTSHSRTKKGKRKPEREQLMMLSFENNKIEKIHTWALRDQIMKSLEKLGKQIDLKTVESASPDEGGLNIEGLAHHGGNLYIGLRSPVTKDGKAILLIVNNANDLLQNASPNVHKIHLIEKLSGNGIRSLDADKDSLIILGGSKDDNEQPFVMQKMNWETMGMRMLDISGFSNLLRPEGIVQNGKEITFVQDFETPQNQDVIVQLQLGL